MADNTYDAIVIGSGISGGWAAKELTEKGLMARNGKPFFPMQVLRIMEQVRHG